MTVDAGETCGSYRVTRYSEGLEAEIRWCDRIEGPCPYVGAVQSKESDRRCALDPGRVLRVSWAPDLIDEAYLRLGQTDQRQQDVDVARDALRACGAGEATDAG